MSIATKLALIQAKIEKARLNSPLATPNLAILAASKEQSEESIEEAIAAGVLLFGENRVQEALAKWPDIKRRHSKVKLHLIGPLQSNKVKQALELFDVIQTVDRPKLAEALAGHKAPGTRHFYIQVNTGKEPQKAGISPEEADGFIDYCISQLKLPVIGLMCVPPADQPPAPHFALLRKIAQAHGLSELSMGMSEDFETAIRMGSTCVRIGRGLFGER